ncbi:MAG: LysM peptidoglycan-binding domain-containing protein [Bacteroidetes bacterium]|nr:LysM peptidoglycan-binding domain-containing protein [Bacteroidota bacterium]
MKSLSITFLMVIFFGYLAGGQPNQKVLDYIDQYKEIAVREMITYKIPASITMAQGILESGAGQSELALKSNNHFGIKCHTDWKGEKVYYDDDAKDECFRKYEHVEESYRDHSEFLVNKTRYAALFELDITDYKGWAKGLKSAGYATNPKYADLLINLIEDYNLQELDKMTAADIKKSDKKDDKKKHDPVVKEDVKTDTKPKKVSWGGYNEEVYYHNRIPTVTIQSGDSPESLAEKHHIKLKLLKDYNDIENGGDLQPGTKFYLQPKRKKGDTKYHVVKQGETMWSISRDEGVRLSQLYKFNQIHEGQEPAVGEEVNLRSKRKDDLKLATKTTTKPKTEVNQKEDKPKQEKSNSEPVEKTEFKDKNDDAFIDFEEEIIAPEVEEKQPSTKPEDPVSTGVKTTEPVTSVAIYHTVAAQETLYAISKKYQVTVAQIQKWNNLPDTNIKIGQQLIVGYK